MRPMMADSQWRRALLPALVVTWALVLARSLVFLLYPHASFDSDQAVVGLMAKHLSEGRAFPLYLYGYSYMLAVQAWVAVPFFWLLGATAGALKASVVMTNLITATLLVTGLVRWGGLRPWPAVLAALFFILAPPDTAASIVDASGGSVEPFLWVLLLWFVRDRPFVFGTVLAVGFLNREFTVYAVPALLAGQAWSRTLWTRGVWHRWLLSLVAFAVVWQGVQVLTPLADLSGPGTAGAVPAVSSAPLANLAARVQIDLAGAPRRALAVIARDVRILVGGRGVTQIAAQGRDWLGLLLAVFAVLAVGRVLHLLVRRQVPVADAAMGWYVLGIGILAVVGYVLTRPGEVVTPRYLLLSLFMPCGLTAVWWCLEPQRRVRIGIAATVLVWASVSAVDTWRQFDRFASGRTGDGMAPIIAALDARGITLAEGPHWRAYKITFLTQERIVVASTDLVRVQQYRMRADDAGPGLVRIQMEPCGDEPSVGGVFICEPGS